MTASEPLSIEEEYKMQEEWKNDPKKCTFIIAKKSDLNSSQLIGDINLFMNDFDDPSRAELSVMIANQRDRHQGHAYEAIELIINYAVVELNIGSFYCKIQKENIACISLFQRLGFYYVSDNEVFREVEYGYMIDAEREREIREREKYIERGRYDDERERENQEAERERNVENERKETEKSDNKERETEKVK
mmetsp:Transcript_14038/g.14134  ORF Transcript_14038/g.14134 Transcript_14038/m.14134 type:complete len:192 (-) Transcript_14038:90-665(-)